MLNPTPRGGMAPCVSVVPSLLYPTCTAGLGVQKKIEKSVGTFYFLHKFHGLGKNYPTARL